MDTGVNSLVSTVLEKLFNMATEELAMQLRLVDDVNKLRVTLETVHGFLQDLEKKNIKDVSMKLWLNRINQDIYDIEDLLEDYGALKENNNESMSNKEDKSSSSSSTKVRCCFPVKCSFFKKVASNHWIGVELQRLNKQLSDPDIKDQIQKLLLISNYPSSSPVESQQTSNDMPTYEIVRSDIVGNRIHDDARRLIELLTKDDARDNPLVYAIVGMGGIGKTTLAKLVFHDRMIENSFQVKVWVSVTQNFNEIDITVFVYEDGESFHHFNTFSAEFKNTVEGKKLFMVLDDMWEVERVWKDRLRTLLKSYAGEGSRVLVTTRNEEVAGQMMAVHSQGVEPLHPEDGWSLLCNSAFPVWEQKKAKDDEWNLKDIGIELVKKCDGLPLAINAIGGMLSSPQSKTRESWELVLKSSMWEVEGLPKDVHSALYISYQDLPTNIKRCFLYCSLFPKGEYFKIVNAKNLWIQEGLIKDERNISSHDVAERYITTLVQRNLVILDRVYIEASYFTMHDLVYSLSQFLTQNENIVAAEEDILKSGFDGKIKKLRRLSIIGGPDKTTNIRLKFLQEQASLRTLLIFDKTIDNIDNALFNHLRYLRTLWLQGTEVIELPESLGSLKLLRYLNLSQTPIKELPKTIRNLNALRILDVSECENLYNLPSSIMKLHHLCSLTTKGSALDHLPSGVGDLNKLQRLEFIMPLEDIARESSTVKELETLRELRRLDLFKLERVLDRSEPKSAALKDKQHLKELVLSCSESDSKEVFKEDTDRIEEVFEDLRPPVQLKFLKITDYFGCKLPSWLGSTPFNFPPINVRYLEITRCSNCKKLDGLGLLPNLEALYIEGASSIKSIGPEFYTSNNGNNIENGAYQNYGFFPRMKLLSFKNMDSWEEWSSLGKAMHVMPHLEILEIYACPKLKSFPEELLYHAATSLKRIRICKATQLLLKEVHNLPFLEIIDIGNIPYLERISGLPALQRLRIEDCPGINLVELTHTLQNIDWKDFNADSLPMLFSNNGHRHDDNIKATFLRISCKEELARKICFDKENGVHEWSKIQHFDNIIVWDENECLRLAYTKTPHSFTSYHGQHKQEDFLGSIDEEEVNMLNIQHVEVEEPIVLVMGAWALSGTRMNV